VILSAISSAIQYIGESTLATDQFSLTCFPCQGKLVRVDAALQCLLERFLFSNKNTSIRHLVERGMECTILYYYYNVQWQHLFQFSLVFMND